MLPAHALLFLLLTATTSGQVTFELTAYPPTSQSPRDVVIADVDLDGRGDLLVVASDAAKMDVFLNTAGGFEHSSFPVAPSPDDIAVGDFDGDCFPDVAIATVYDGVAILANDGQGGFDAPVFHAAGPPSGPRSVAVGDFDNDGALDVVTTNRTSNDFWYLQGDGQGGFAQATSYPTQFGPNDIAIGDFNEDGALDVALACASYRVALHRGTGGGQFAPWGHMSSGDYPVELAITDFDLDGHLDIACLNDAMGGTDVFLGSGNLSFPTQINIPSGLAHGIEADDVNLDGRPDIVVAGTYVYLGQPGGFSPFIPLPPGGEWNIDLGDLNGDRIPDVAGVVIGSNLVRIYTNRTVPWVQSPVNGHWYHLAGRASWLDGELTALSYGGHLATIRSAAENDWVRGLLAGADGFLGFTDVYSEGNWIWTSGDPVTHTAWAQGEPDDVGGADFCVMGANGEWRDEPASALLPGVVEVISGDCDQDGYPDAFEIEIGWEADVDGNGVPDSCTSPVYCDSNPNSTGQTAALSVVGSPVIWRNDLTFVAANVPANQFGYYLMSMQAASVPLFGGGQGDLCLGLPIVRFAGDVLFSGPTGNLDFSPDFTALPQNTTFTPGDTWLFQAWFRDLNPGVTSNTSDAVAVTFTTTPGPLVQFAVERAIAAESAGQVAVRVTLSQPTTEDVSLPFVHAGTATELQDYTLDTASPLVVPAGSVCGEILVTVLQDGFGEPDETITFELGPPTGARLGATRDHVLTIVD